MGAFLLLYRIICGAFALHQIAVIFVANMHHIVGDMHWVSLPVSIQTHATTCFVYKNAIWSEVQPSCVTVKPTNTLIVSSNCIIYHSFVWASCYFSLYCKFQNDSHWMNRVKGQQKIHPRTLKFSSKKITKNKYRKKSREKRFHSKFRKL